jgi:uncharacterized protein (DUF1499 family)
VPRTDAGSRLSVAEQAQATLGTAGRMRYSRTVTNTLGLVGGAAMLAGVVLAWLRVVPGMVGFVLFALGGLLCLVAAVAAIVRLVRGRGLGSGGVVSLVATALLVASAMRGAGLPRTNDFTTDLDDPPAFRHAATLPANAGRSLDYPAGFAEQQRACCADLRPARLAVPPADAFARARATAESMPRWEVTTSELSAGNPSTGTVEAVATTAIFGFQDDIVIRVRPDPTGAGSIVDLRSKSRDGRGDLGANAARIRDYVARLERAG